MAIIGLFVALSGHTYNTWRDKIIEENRNVRIASFEVLKNLWELQLVVDYAHFQKNQWLGNPITGWGKVLLIKDLSRVIPEPAPKPAERLYQTWQQEFDKLEGDEKGVERVTQKVASTRHTVLKALARLM